MSSNTALQTTDRQLNLAQIDLSFDNWKMMREQASMLVATGFLPQSIKTPEQAIAIMLQGRELGIPTMAALGTINVIQGKPTISPQLMLALINRSGQLENIEITNTPNGVSCTMKRKGRVPHTEIFGAKEAANMNLNGKDNYKKQAATMYRWRAVAACARTVFPDVILGVYTPDEMGAENVNADGELMPEAATVHRLPSKAQLAESLKEEMRRAEYETQHEEKTGQFIDSSAKPLESLNFQPTDEAPASVPNSEAINQFCKKLNAEGDSIKWKPSVLVDYINAFFDDVEGYEPIKKSHLELDADDMETIKQDLSTRYEELLGIKELNSPAIEGEVIQPTDEDVVF